MSRSVRAVALALCLVAAAGIVAAVVFVAMPKPSVADRIAMLFPDSEDYDFTPPKPGSYRLPPLKAVPDGEVLDRKGEPQRLHDVFAGKVTLVSFVYFLCSDSNGCPLATSTLFDLFDASAELPGFAKRVQLVTISFDPKRDTPEAVDSFIYPVLVDPERDRKIDWQAFTGRSEASLQPILDRFGQVVDRRTDSDVINHLLRLYLIDEKGRIRNIYGLGMIDPRLILTDIETLLMEEGTSVARADL